MLILAIGLDILLQELLDSTVNITMHEGRVTLGISVYEYLIDRNSEVVGLVKECIQKLVFCYPTGIYISPAYSIIPFIYIFLDGAVLCT